MATPSTREQTLSKFRSQIEQGKPIIGAGAGIGLSAKSAEAGGCDLIIIYNSGRFRMAGHGSLAGLMPFSNANSVVVEMAPEILVAAPNTPIIAGVCATDPFVNMRKFLKDLTEMGIAGVQNFPTVGLIDGNFRQALEETGMGYDKEVEMVRVASDMGILTTPYVFNASEAVEMAEAGADVIVAHMGLTTSGSIGAKTGKSLEECVDDIQAIVDAVGVVKGDEGVKEGVIILCHGGPIADPEDAEFVLKRVRGLHGFFGASSMERLPVERAIKEVAMEFKSISLPK